MEIKANGTLSPVLNAADNAVRSSKGGSSQPSSVATTTSMTNVSTSALSQSKNANCGSQVTPSQQS